MAKRGDAREALKALPVANDFLERQLEHVGPRFRQATVGDGSRRR